MVKRLVKYCISTCRVERSQGHYFYTHFYMAQALYQRAGDDRYKKDWQDYYRKIRTKLLGLQSPDGSWNGDSVGTTYGTAIATIILQLPYGYLPICQR